MYLASARRFSRSECTSEKFWDVSWSGVGRHISEDSDSSELILRKRELVLTRSRQGGGQCRGRVPWRFLSSKPENSSRSRRADHWSRSRANHVSHRGVEGEMLDLCYGFAVAWSLVTACPLHGQCLSVWVFTKCHWHQHGLAARRDALFLLFHKWKKNLFTRPVSQVKNFIW